MLIFCRYQINDSSDDVSDVACFIRAPEEGPTDGLFKVEHVEDSEAGFQLEEHEELVSHIIKVESNEGKHIKFNVNLSRVPF